MNATPRPFYPGDKVRFIRDAITDSTNNFGLITGVIYTIDLSYRLWNYVRHDVTIVEAQGLFRSAESFELVERNVAQREIHDAVSSLVKSRPGKKG
jgi:uncharacterized protein (DUF2235 family)